jgi:hypothetical protein
VLFIGIHHFSLLCTEEGINLFLEVASEIFQFSHGLTDVAHIVLCYQRSYLEDTGVGADVSDQHGREFGLILLSITQQ